MDLLKARLFNAGLFKQAKFLVSQEQNALMAMYISEASVVSKEQLPIHTGFVAADTAKKAWLVLHGLKGRIRKNGILTDDAVLSISDRSYLPLDPHDRIKPTAKLKLLPLPRIAKMQHAGVRLEAGKQRDSQEGVALRIVNGCFILLAFIGVAALLMSSCSGGAG